MNVPAPDNPTPPEDPFDIIARAVPRDIWLSLAVVTVTVLAGLIFFGRVAPTGEDAVTQTVEGRVVAVLGEEQVTGEAGISVIQTVVVAFTRGDRRGEQVEIRYGEAEAITAESRAKTGDRVLVEVSAGPEGEHYYISDFVRWPSLLALALAFSVAAVTVGGMTGLRALAGMGFSVLIIATFIVPGILAGHDPLLIALIGALALLTATIYLTYGWRPKTHAAWLGMSSSLALTGALSVAFVSWARLTGLSDESSLFLRFGGGATLDPRGILLGGIVIGALGVLDDIATNQASVVFELKRAAPGLSRGELFRRGMVVGRDHIAAVVNTLLLAYAGASLPLLLLIAVEGAPLGQLLNRGFMAEEIVRTLAGSLGLILATPITSLIAAWLAGRPHGQAAETRHPPDATPAQ